MQAPEVERDQQHKLFISTLGHMKIFGLIQNLAFLFGAGDFWFVPLTIDLPSYKLHYCFE